MMASVKKKVAASPPFAALEEAVRKNEHPRLRNIAGSLMAFAAVHLFEERGAQLLLVVPDDDRAEQLRDDCVLLAGDENVRLLGHSVEHHARLLDMTSPIAQIETLQALAEQRRVLVIASASSAATCLPPPQALLKRKIELLANTDTSFEQLIARLNELGFERKDFVEEYGDFAVRGGILDVFPFVGDNPVRVEFWGDTIESLREFDALSQRSIRSLQSAHIVASLNAGAPDATQSSSIFSYLQSNAIVLLDEPALIEKEIDELHKEGVPHVYGWASLDEHRENFFTLIHSTFVLQQSGVDRTPSEIDFSSVPTPPTNGAVKILLKNIAELNERRLSVVIGCDTKHEADRLEELIDEEQFAVAATRATGEEPADADSTLADRQPTLSYSLTTTAFHNGFVFPAAGIALLSEHEIFGRLKRRGSGKRRRFKGMSQKDFAQLKRGDFVVHVDYGIGRFERLQKIHLRGVEAEVMKLSFAEGDSIYVNLNFMNRVQKYASQEGHAPQLTKLGSPDWDRLKSKARRKIKDIARDLIRLYAKRKLEQGFAFQSDVHWQKEMEASFMYEDTPDQAKATLDVKSDMESGSPMDRLICGDVGFGKTEIAVRAAFKSVMNGKQAAVLVPTTILAQQHFNTFVDRVGRYGVRVESLSRFRSSKEQKDIVGALKEGAVDVIIGTHRLLSKDVAFKDLGLLVVDEEHRFGVSAKEKLRQLRAAVDTLTLTATPIPRTLQFSLMGARDLSIINTPPRNRLPIVTEIAQYDLQLVREAILKELHRGGQAYFIHDRINNMDEVEALLRERIPEARFHAAHGQMPGHELERTMMSFLEKKFDVLVCTKIIESGIDIPSVNTIIINRADRFGLAELYQLRGRVGRSNVQAYAYLLTPPISVLPKQTLRRLQAIQEFTELGSGFNLAMRDMEIRGTGNLLGAEQSGFILEMGFEMYQRIVEEAVAELKEEEFSVLLESGPSAGGRQAKPELVVETDVEALIPDIYIESDAERLEIYRRLYKADSLGELESLRSELQDRFGEYPEEVEHLFRVVGLKLSASSMRFARIELNGTEATLTLPPSEDKLFYEPGEAGASLFQNLMDRVGKLKQYQLALKQDGKRLKLVGRIQKPDSDRERLLAFRNMIVDLQTRET
ncbi:MAG: transcription-repair coupling factor [Ignavibacteriales bacterium]|nr:transcription-repair coupling factor [Ignavibacteriales bacterium]